MMEGTLPISLEELYEKEKKRPSRSALSIEQLLEQLRSENQRERSASRTEINDHEQKICGGNNQAHGKSN